ncbi:hypothetical protein NEIPOLOT_02521 [Neisseria polysaccharea ATCC 43768]|nr:hypothetical protein NEIPOLOT_02521 [Neisseria polysaccharea ATCC 43768]
MCPTASTRSRKSGIYTRQKTVAVQNCHPDKKCRLKRKSISDGIFKSKVS